MAQQITVIVPVPVVVDLEDYALTYGFDGVDDETTADAKGHTAELVRGGAEVQLRAVDNGSRLLPTLYAGDLLEELVALLKVTSVRELHARIRLLRAQLTTEV